jgi:hypothetical protein
MLKTQKYSWSSLVISMEAVHLLGAWFFILKIIIIEK